MIAGIVRALSRVRGLIPNGRGSLNPVVTPTSLVSHRPDEIATRASLASVLQSFGERSPLAAKLLGFVSPAQAERNRQTKQGLQLAFSLKRDDHRDAVGKIKDLASRDLSLAHEVALVDILTSSAHPDVHVAALEGLDRAGKLFTRIGKLHDMLSDSKTAPIVRIAIVGILGGPHSTSIPQLVQTVIQDQDSNVRLAACAALAGINSSEYEPWIMKTLVDIACNPNENVSVRVAAIAALDRASYAGFGELPYLTSEAWQRLQAMAKVTTYPTIDGAVSGLQNFPELPSG